MFYFEIITQSNNYCYPDNPIDGAQRHIVRFTEIIRSTFTQELNNLKVVSFYVMKQGDNDHNVNYNIKFENEYQARHLSIFKVGR